MSKIGLIFNGVWSHYVFAKAPKYRHIYELLYLHNLEDAAVQHLEALVIPSQTNQKVMAEKQEVIYRFLASGKKVFVEGDTTPDWLNARWEDRPVNNYWWVTEPNNPPVAHTDYDHPVYQGLEPRHACWHTHGVYTRIPQGAEIIQTNGEGEIVSWQTSQYGGILFVTTLDPIVEHGVQQITHLDHYVDKLTYWLCGVQPQGKVEVLASDFGTAAFG